MTRHTAARVFHWHDTFVHRSRLEAKVESISGLRVGAGRAMMGELCDLPVLRDAAGQPFIPGSSIKGALRSFAEALLRGMAVAVGASPSAHVSLDRVACDPIGEHCLKVITEEDKDTPGQGGRSTALRERDKVELVEGNICLACATFGAPHMASHVRFADAPVEDGQPAIRDGVAIDRDLGRVAGAMKYDYEVLNPGATFRLQVHLNDDQPWQTALLLLALEELERGGIRLGGFGSRGMGLVSVTEKSLHRLSLDDILDGGQGIELDMAQVRDQGIRELRTLVEYRWKEGSAGEPDTTEVG